ncbi:MAG: alpha/beta hydrolase [Deltaproteobacteria bacterium]|nr:alpha/beta hydrolase [Deltaproteobacteria bacterium]
MRPIVLIHGYSAESKQTDPASVEKIYGSMPDALRGLYGDGSVVEIDLSRYISLEDGIHLDDISRAFDRALHMADYAHLLAGGFDAIIHSTGALVIRNWLRRFSPRPSPLDNLIYLAGANLGSGWAHIGKGQLAKWGRLVFQAGAERGMRVLDALELGSEETIDLHLFFTEAENSPDQVYKVREHIIVGTQADGNWYEAPLRYAKEDGSDGVVRVAASNLNFIYCRLGPTAKALALDWPTVLGEVESHLARAGDRSVYYEKKRVSMPGSDGRPELPFAIPYECAHSGDNMGVVTGDSCRQQVLGLIEQALASDEANWKDRLAFFKKETKATYKKVKTRQQPSLWPWSRDPRNQYDKHAQVIFRLRDQDGRPVNHFDIFFNSLEIDRETSTPFGELIEDKHINKKSPNVIAFYLRVETFDIDQNKWVNQLEKAGAAWLEITAIEPETDFIQYVPFRIKLSKTLLKQWIQPHRTTIFDVELLRIPGPDVFKMTKMEE